jgi:hypothetical protein
MFRKIRSNRDPRDTVFTELRKEFRPYVDKVSNGAKRTTIRYPKVLFWFMVVNLGLSAVLSFTVFRNRDDAVAKKPLKIITPLTGGIGQVMQAGEAIREMISLRRRIDSLSAKKQLAPADSVFLDSALTRFNQLNKQFNPRK